MQGGRFGDSAGKGRSEAEAAQTRRTVSFGGKKKRPPRWIPGRPFLFCADYFGRAKLRMAATVTFELVLFELAAERIAVNSQSARGAALIAFHVIHHALNEAALEF